ncbi:hypothetical protein ABEB36_003012 [Hypothenemus hampei]|uniref:Uncharacterized protein n=1 Tax=Hypothenemus hampei TaxID=57062 RepID=A0ABD1F7Q5_HYPHA
MKSFIVFREYDQTDSATGESAKEKTQLLNCRKLLKIKRTRRAISWHRDTCKSYYLIAFNDIRRNCEQNVKEKFFKTKPISPENDHHNIFNGRESLSAVAFPHFNRQLERYIKTLLDGLNTSIENKTEWYDKLPQVIMGLNKSANVSTGFTLHRFMFGFERNIIEVLKENSHIKIDREDDKKRAKLTMDKQRIIIYQTFDKHRKSSTKYKINDLVLWSIENTNDTDTSRKTGNKFNGPYKITKE